MFLEAFTQIQDVVIPGGVLLDTPFRFLDAFTCGLAARLAVHYAPERLGQYGNPDAKIPGSGLIGAYERAWSFATTADTENRPLQISPNLSGYFRG